MLARIFLLITFIASGQLSFSQGPQLVADLLSGPDGAFSNSYQESIVFGDKILLALSTSSTGRELAIIENGEVQILKDIFPGPDGSGPELFIEFKGKVVFKANDGQNSSSRFWVTDGTEAGTQKVDLPSEVEGTIQNLIVSNAGNLYFSVDNSLYRTSDLITFNLINLLSGSLTDSSVDGSPRFVKFQDEIAYILGNRNEKELFVVEGDTSLLKASIVAFRGSQDVFGLTDMGPTLMFVTDWSLSPDLDNNYMYRPAPDSLEAFSIDGDKAWLLNPLGNGAALAWVPRQGYYKVTGETPAVELLFAEPQGFYGRDELMRSASYNDRLVFISYGGDMGENYLLFSDGTAQGTRQLKTVESFQSSFLSFDKYAIFAEGIAEELTPKLTLVDMESGDLTTIHSFDSQISVEEESIRPIGVLGNTLYFVSKLDESVGAEVYKIDLDFNSSVEPIANLDLSLVTNQGDFKISSKESSMMVVSQYNSAGALLSTAHVQTNTWQPLAAHVGALFINVEIDGKRKTFRVAQVGE